MAQTHGGATPQPLDQQRGQTLDSSLDLDQPFDAPTEWDGNDWDGKRRSPASNKLLQDYMNPPTPWARMLKGFIVVLVVAGIAHELFAGYYDRKMTAAIREVSGQTEIEVHCRRVWDEVLDFRVKPGFVWFGSGVANLQLNVCRDAAAWSGDPENEDKRIAIQVLTHELAHLAGHYDESQTECVAMWTLPKTADALGGTREDGLAVASWYAANYNPLLPPEYNAPGCLDGSPPSSPLLP